MTEFYKNLGYNAYYMMNNVKSLDIDKEEKNLDDILKKQKK